MRPLTCDIPKPMARLCGRPILEYILELLVKNGVDNAALTLRYLPDRITDHFPDKRFGKIHLDFVEETTPLGTAGGVKNACNDQDDGVLIISGDAMCDFDLAAFASHHRQSGADVTILAKRVEDPREYGLVDVDSGMNIVGFIEKPAFSQAVSDLANTGIYLLSSRALKMIPEGKSYDFAKDLFPKMLEQGMKLLCWEGKGYWCDIGDLDSYIGCQQDMLEGKVRCNIPGQRDPQGNIFVQGVPGNGVQVVAPVYIGSHVRIEDGAIIEAGSVIDHGCYIGRDVRVSGSVLLQDSYISQRARLTGALVCAGATVKNGAMLFEGATVGAGAIVGERATIHAGVKIWNHKKIPDSTTVTTHVKTAVQGREFFDDDGITGQIGVELTPEFCARMGGAIGSLVPGARIAVGCSNHRSAKVLAAALSAGIQATGTHVMDFGEGFLAQFAFSMNFSALPMGIYIKGDRQAGIKVLSAGGLPATRDVERTIEMILSRGEFVRCSHDDMGDRVEMTGMTALYKSQMLRYAPKGLAGCCAQVKCHNLALKTIMRDVLYGLGCDLTAGIVLEFSSQGDKVRIYDPDLGYIPHHKIFTWCAMHELERGEDVAIPYDAPRVIDDIAFQVGHKALRYYACPADDSDAAARKLAKSQLWCRDALMQAVLFLHMARKAGGISALIERAPDFDCMVRTVDTTGNPAALLQGLGQRDSGDGKVAEGVLFKEDRGVVLVRPLKRGTGIKIFAEAVSAEIAAELCDSIEKRIQQRMEPTLDRKMEKE